MTAPVAAPVLDVRGLRVSFRGFEGVAEVLQGVDLTVGKGERVGLVGESGCGKSVTMRAIMGILRAPPARVDGGEIRYLGRDVLTLGRRERDLLKGRDLSMVFQDPGTSLNPVFRIGEQLDDVMGWADRRGGERTSRRTRRGRILEVLKQVKLPDPALVYDAYPMQLSGGMRQRVLIAMALLNRPTLLIADEPGTALDVTTQDEILRLLDALVQHDGLSMLLISHNLGVVRAMTDRLYVMYAGAVVEEGATADVFADPRHPYTQALLRCVPKLDGSAVYAGIDGTLPDYTRPPGGCRFHPRCGYAHARCSEARPPAFEVGAGPVAHRSACWLEEPR
ncbi:MAG: ABC transporter ATP-binding protein [Trueperaceae bacterium]|nr:ABC transporter ATP-binding protein [Trueperaceae bacterium]